MNFKIDTKEKFDEITILETDLPANMTESITKLFTSLLEKETKSIVLCLQEVASMDLKSAEAIAHAQHSYYEHNASFVIWGLQTKVEAMLDEHELLEQMNVTPTLSEAWDIVQMEEIERELLDNF